MSAFISVLKKMQRTLDNGECLVVFVFELLCNDRDEVHIRLLSNCYGME